ncbi:MAG TPA: UvrD-helicase domain-containing protein, partial [Acidobacteriota bacterium]|nr:UvrD-helicase domain-containing protein [Acidobacteriota bacterium]
PPSDEEFRAIIDAFLLRAVKLISRVKTPDDKLAGMLSHAIEWLERPSREAGAPGKPGGAGAAGKWEGGRDTVEEARILLREIAEFGAMYTTLPMRRLIDEVIRWISRSFIWKEWEGKKTAAGLLDFDDQLYLARELLRNHAEVRADFRNRYKTLLVDEFQDTDPVQLEIVLLLSSENVENAAVDGLCPGPGRLFIVGDPKQSIYRFRNADIEAYLGFVEPLKLQIRGIERLRLTANFRSVPSILDFVDGAFGDIMKQPAEGGRYQPDYMPFAGCGARTGESHPPAVQLLADTGNESRSLRAGELMAKESLRVAALVAEMVGSSSWSVQEAGEGSQGRRRPPRYGDIAVLLPVLNHADALEAAFRAAGIPYVLEGGKFYYSRSEVSSAITVLRAIANPNDRVALFGALRSIFFGLSDEDLLKACKDEIALDYRSGAPRGSPLQYPFEILSDLHRHRHSRRASETFELLLRATGAREVLAVRGFQSPANLDKLTRSLRALQAGAGFSQVVDIVGALDEDALAESESRLMEEHSDAVRVMSIHKSKGLDFPIVIVGALGLKKQNRAFHLLADPHHGKVFGVKIGSGEAGMQTWGWDELADREKKLDEAELARLLYVALTRARDHLVVSALTTTMKKIKDGDRYIPDMEGTRLEPIGAFLEDCCLGPGNKARIIDPGRLDDTADAPSSRPAPAETHPDWEIVVGREYRMLSDLLGKVSSSRLREEDSPEGALESGDRSRKEQMPNVFDNRAVRLGTAFHEAMERVDIRDKRVSAGWLRDLEMRHKLDGESAQMLREMVSVTLESELFERALAASASGGRILREVPFARRLNESTVVEGKIDLLFEEADGWVLVDYKTDYEAVAGEPAGGILRERYRCRIEGYLEALRELSITVGSAYLLLARTGEAVRMM